MLTFDEEQLLDWTEGIRKHPDMLNAFWPSQIKSKIWLTDWVKSYLPSAHKIVIFGAWYGLLADMLDIRLKDTKILCNDIDKDAMLWCSRRHATQTGRLEEFTYETRVDLVINTVTEHLTQDIYDKWYDNIPKGTYFVIQGNNDYKEADHVRACSSLTEFNRINKVENTLHSGSMSYEGPWNEVDNRPTYYERYMTIGFKSEYNK
jgi:hypothetical protein